MNSKKKPNKDICFLQNSYSHLVLDMDGVVINSIQLMEKAWQLSGGINFSKFEEFKKFIGIPFKEVCFKLNIPSEKISDLEKNYFFYTEQLKNKITLYPYVKKTLLKISSSGIKISIISSKKYENIISIISNLDIQFDIVIAPGRPDYTGKHKPSGEPILFACNRLKKQPQDSIFVGDMLSDYNASLDAGVDFIFASWGYGKINDKKEMHVISSFKELNFLIR